MRSVRGLLLTYVVLGLFGVLPIIGAVAAESIGDRYGCAVHEGFANPCLVNGRDIGGTLHSLFVMGWFFFVTMPLALVVGFGWTIVWLVWRWRAAKRPPHSSTSV